MDKETVYKPTPEREILAIKEQIITIMNNTDYNTTTEELRGKIKMIEKLRDRMFVIELSM